MRRGLDVVDCESATKIRAKYLRALEEEQFETLPGPTFVRGFLRTYSDFLGLDGRLVVEEYETRFERPKEQSAYEEALRRNRSHRRSRESRLLTTLAVLAMAGSVSGWVALAGDGASDPPPIEPTAAPADPISSLELRFTVVGAPTTIEAWNGGGLNQVLGRVALTAGTPEQLIAAPPVLVQIGRPGSVRLTVDDHPVTIPPRATRFEVRSAGDVVMVP